MVASGSSRTFFNVINYGAVGDGTTDDSHAFKRAWEAICGATTINPTLYIPQGKTFLLYPISFRGPCNSYIHVMVLGNIVAPKDTWAWEGHDQEYWISFARINGLYLHGNGQIDGQGYNWWQSCPAALVFFECINLQLSGLKHLNSQRSHISIAKCKNVILSHLHINAPETSPNTDGIDIAYSTNVKILHSYIGTGDDCIAVNAGNSDINITGITCGPGHGISIGSLGVGKHRVKVENVHVKNCIFNRTLNGARIKTWPGGHGYAKRISFKKIKLYEVTNPIVIDQFYCPYKQCNTKGSAVRISHVSYSGFEGTSINSKAINFSCSRKQSCTKIVLNHIRLTSTDAGYNTYSYCRNTHGIYQDSIPKVDCLLH
ncbi:hypothetical protein SLE2022_381970 [Rubroshorea leprosula]